MEFVDFDLAKKLKEKGFPQRPDYFNYSSYYNFDGLRKTHSLTNASVWFDPNINRNNIYFAPIISQVLKWLREEKKLFVEPSLFKAGYEPFVQSTIFEDDKDYTDTWRIKGFYPTYEQAAIAGISYVLDNLI